MNCEDYSLMLDEYVENELDEKGVAWVLTHIAVCAACAGYYTDLKREQERYSQYLLDVEATPALWTNVQASIEKNQPEHLSSTKFNEWLAKTFGVSAFNPVFAVIPLVLMITLGIITGVIKYQSAENTFSEEMISQKTESNRVQFSPEKNDEDAKSETLSPDKTADVSKPENKVSIAQVKNRNRKIVSRLNSSKPANQFINSESGNPNRKLTTEETVEKAERQYKSAIAILSRDIKRRRAQLSPNLISQFEQSLSAVDRTINETRRAVRQQPRDPVIVQYMTAAYAKKIELLREIGNN